MSDFFRKFSTNVAELVGSAYAFILSLLVIAGWIITGPVFNFSDTWQLIINSITSIVTFLMVFIIQNSQNRDTKIIQLKLDELIRAVQGARNKMIDLEDLTDQQVGHLKKEFQKAYGDTDQELSELSQLNDHPIKIPTK